MKHRQHNQMNSHSVLTFPSQRIKLFAWQQMTGAEFDHSSISPTDRNYILRGNLYDNGQSS